MSLPRPFGQYTLLRRLAVGGMAEIYVAKTRGLGGFEKAVAIKLVHPHLAADPHFVRMLVDEAKILVLLTHANIAQVFDLGRIDGTYFIAMEYVEGVDIFGLQKAAAKVKRPLPVPVCCFIVAEMLNGLDYAHRKRDADGKQLNIVHRDISPQNVLISQAGEVKLVDFGIAKTNLRGEGTEVGVIKGKYYYMSPEQAWADPMDRRSDIFSTGIVLYEMLTGRMLYGATSIPELISRVREAEIAPPETLRADIPLALSKIVMKALEREQKGRYQSALDMGEALRDFLYETAPSFTAGRLASFVTELIEDGSKIETGKHSSDTTGRLRALTRDEFVRSESSVLFDLKNAGLATRAENPVRARRPSSVEMAAVHEPPLGAPAAPNTDRAPPVSMPSITDRAPPAFAPPTFTDRAILSDRAPAPANANESMPKLRVPLPPVRPPGRARFTDQALESVPPTEVMSRPPELPPVGRVSAWPHDSVRPSNDSQRPGDAEDPTELWTSSAFRPPVDETLIDSQAAIGFANTEMLLRSHVLDASRLNRTGNEELEPTSKYSAANASALAGRARWGGQEGLQGTAAGTPALVPPPGELGAMEPIPPSPPIPDFGPSDRLFRGGGRGRPFSQIAIAIAFMVLGIVVYQVLRRQKPEPQLEIVSVPAGAKVSVDKQVQEGVTPLRISGLEAGRKYDLRVDLGGYVPWEATYHASPGAVRHIAVLKPITGEVHVASEPTGSDVWLDGVPIGKTPLTISSISVGRRVRLRVGHPGYADVRREVAVEESNLRTTLKLSLTRSQ